MRLTFHEAPVIHLQIIFSFPEQPGRAEAEAAFQERERRREALCRLLALPRPLRQRRRHEPLLDHERGVQRETAAQQTELHAGGAAKEAADGQQLPQEAASEWQ